MTSAKPPTAPSTAPTAVRELFTNRWLLLFLAVWAVATVHIFTTDRSVLPLSDQEPIGYFSGIAGGVVTLALLLLLARRQAPLDHRNAPDFRNPGTESAGLLAWMAAVLAVGSVFGIRTHIAFVGLAPGAQAVWDRQTPATTLTWAIFNFVTLAVLPYCFFRYRLGYRPDSMLLRFGRPKVWVPFFILAGLPPILFVATPEYYTTSVAGHALTLVLFTLGSFLPIMITTQSLLAPRLSVLARSWVTGSVLTALAYGALNITEAFLAWDSLAQVALSLAWFMQVAFWGLAKAVTTLRTGNAWLHIATTHTLHLAEAPAVATTFGLR
ncbi:hypothetical protein J5X84_02880 [Streptosporangiaceae bacterium NEAU-GS5]|nr:hypothetical protein [Streptosporangiaceae bacterium NEAU-GS5]